MGAEFRGDEFGDILYENPGFGNHWISVKLVGIRSNCAAIGARIRGDIIAGEKKRSIFRHVNSGGSFGANPLRQTIGLAKAERVEVLEVSWPGSGTTQVFRNVPVDEFIRIVEGERQYTRTSCDKLKLGG